MRTFWALALCMACAAMGQISSMATDYAGQRLLFATTLSQSGSSQPNYGKLFTADWQGVNPLLIYNRDILSTTGLYGNPGLLTNYYDVVATDISSNGAYISVAALNECSGYTKGLCGSGYQSTLYDTHGQVALIARGQVILSRNGAWAMAVDPPTEGGTVFTLYDITAATKFPVGEYLAAFSGAWQHAVANNGTAVVATQDGLLIFEPASTMQMVQGTSQMWVQSAVVDPAGTVAVWEQIDDYPVGNSSLHAVRTADLSKTMNLTASGLSDFRPHISDDGSTLLFLSTSIGEPFGAHTQASIMAIDGSGRHPVTNEPDGIVDAVLSGNGQVVWALTGTGRLLRSIWVGVKPSIFLPRQPGSRLDTG